MVLATLSHWQHSLSLASPTAVFSRVERVDRVEESGWRFRLLQSEGGMWYNILGC